MCCGLWDGDIGFICIKYESTNQRIEGRSDLEWWGGVVYSSIRSEEVGDFEKIWLWTNGLDAVCLKC